MRIYNSDGGEVEACGNAARAIGLLHGKAATIETAGGLIATFARMRMVSPSTWASRASTGTRSRWPIRWTRSPCRWAGTILEQPDGGQCRQSARRLLRATTADAVAARNARPGRSRPIRCSPNASTSTSPALRTRQTSAPAGVGTRRRAHPRLRHRRLRHARSPPCGAGWSTAKSPSHLPGGDLLHRLGRRQPHHHDRPGDRELSRHLRLGRLRMSQSDVTPEVISLGCRLNIAESERIRALLGERGRRRGGQ